MQHFRPVVKFLLIDFGEVLVIVVVVLLLHCLLFILLGLVLVVTGGK